MGVHVSCHRSSRTVYGWSDHTLSKHISLNPHPKKAKNPSNTPLANLKDTHRSAGAKESHASGVRRTCAGRLRLVTLRRERSPTKGARDPAARQSVRRSPRSPRKAGDGGLTGNTTKPIKPPPQPFAVRPRRGDGVEVDARGLPTRPCLARGFQTAARRRAKAHAAPRVEAPPPKSRARRPAALSSSSCHVGHTTTVHPLAIHREAPPRSC